MQVNFILSLDVNSMAWLLTRGLMSKLWLQHFQDSGGELVLADVIGLGRDNTGKPFLDSSSGKCQQINWF